MTSSNRKIFRVTGPLCGEFTGQRWIPPTKANDAELWCVFDLRLNKRWWLEAQSRSLWRHVMTQTKSMLKWPVRSTCTHFPPEIHFKVQSMKWLQFFSCFNELSTKNHKLAVLWGVSPFPGTKFYHTTAFQDDNRTSFGPLTEWLGMETCSRIPLLCPVAPFTNMV